MGKENREANGEGETQAHNLGGRQEEDRGDTAGEGEGCEEDCLGPAEAA